MVIYKNNLNFNMIKTSILPLLVCFLFLMGCTQNRILNFEQIKSNGNYTVNIFDSRSQQDKSFQSSSKGIYWGDNNFNPTSLELLKKSLKNKTKENLKVNVEKFQIVEIRRNHYIYATKKPTKTMKDYLTVKQRVFKIRCNFNGLVNNIEKTADAESYFQPGGTYPGILGETKSVKKAVIYCLDKLSAKIIN